MPDWRYAFRIGPRVARGLACAYGHGVIHRNVCPASVLIRSEDKEAKLGGWISAKVVELAAPQLAARPSELLGDIDYMSPERTAGGTVRVDHRSDLFSLGALCYVLLTGRPPFQADTPAQTIARIRAEDPGSPRASQPGLPPPFEEAVMRLLSKHPSDRYHTAGELVEELEQLGRNAGLIKV
jgi:serine/threonine-protein kinase